LPLNKKLSNYNFFLNFQTNDERASEWRSTVTNGALESKLNYLKGVILNLATLGAMMMKFQAFYHNPTFFFIHPIVPPIDRCRREKNKLNNSSIERFFSVESFYEWNRSRVM